MGVYTYSVRAKSIEVEGRKVHSLEYLTKPSFWGDDKITRMLCAKAEAYWAGREAPKFVALADKGKFYEFSSVMEWDGAAVNDDTPDFASCKSRIGYLKKIGRGKWTLAPECFHVSIGKMMSSGVNGTYKCFYVRMSKDFWTLEEAEAFVKANQQSDETNTTHRSFIENGKSVSHKVAQTWHERVAVG